MSMNNLEETFGYDSQNRLTGVWLNLTQTGSSAYDSYGRMTAKTANGQAVFSNAMFNTTAKPHTMDAATTTSGVFPAMAQTVTYTGFDKVNKVKQGNDSICYTYGYDHQRIFMEEHVGNTLRTKRYVGNCEYVTETSGNITASKWHTYLTGPTGVYAVVVTRNNENTIHYVLKDNLGSWTTITDEDGNVEQRLSYDAWGNLRNSDTWSGDFSGTPMFDRGFTGHEHLYSFGLINMNGRTYDPVMSSFLSVDQYVQSPSNPQNFNRYAYCLNNPLRYVDPDGEEFITTAIVVGTVLMGAYTGGVLTNGGNYNPTQWDWDKDETLAGLILGGLFGGLSGFAGVSIAGMGFAFCNTASIAASSLIYSTGMYFTGKCTNFDYGISLSLGVVSFDFTHGEFGYPFKRGNSVLENIGYCLGAVTNLCDAYRYATWQVLSKQQRYDKLYKWAAKNHGENNMEYEPQLIDETGNQVNVEGTYNWETDKIRITDAALSNDFGYAKSTYLHELNHRLDMTPMKRLLIINKALRSIDWDYYDAACDWHNQFYAACDARSYAVELCNASKNGLSLGQYSNILQNYNYYSQLSGVSLQIPRYSIWTLIKSILLP
jgi:RHS repeat-associated protein